MRNFDYASATSLDETFDLLGGAPGATRPLAGGTDLLTLMKADIAAPTRLVDIKRLADLPRGVREEADGALRIGALTTLAAIEHDPTLLARAAALPAAVAAAATPQLRNMATIGGNLLQRPRCWYFRNSLFNCWLKGGEECQARAGENEHHAIFDQGPCVAVHPSDPAAALLALDASVRLRGPRGERTVALGDFFAPPTVGRHTENTLGDDELVIEIAIPSPAAGTRSTYLKAMDRKVWAFAIVGVAATLRVEAGKIAAARLVLGGVANIPWRAAAAEAALLGAAPDEATFARAAEVALTGAVPLAHNGHKVPLATALIRRALADAARLPGAVAAD